MNMPIQPKDAETIRKGFGAKFNIAYVKDKGFAFLGAEIQDYIDSALASFALHLATVLPEKKENLDEVDHDDMAIGSGYNQALSDCRSAILKEGGIEGK